MGAGAARKRAKLVESASVRAVSEAPSENNSMDIGMLPAGADDMSDGELPSWRGNQPVEAPSTPAADEPVPTVEVCAHAAHQFPPVWPDSCTSLLCKI